jgi:hypothetical protein
MTPRGLLIFVVLWLSMVMAIFVIANLGHDDGAANLSFNVDRANRDLPP